MILVSCFSCYISFRILIAIEMNIKPCTMERVDLHQLQGIYYAGIRKKKDGIFGFKMGFGFLFVLHIDLGDTFWL